MKNIISRSRLISSGVMLISFLFGLKAFADTYDRGCNANEGSQRINEEQFVLINGLEQWVTIKGESSKPVILFLHGGPGSPLTPFADTLYNKWEKDFILVQWDQRGSGRTFGHNGPGELSTEYLKSNPLTVEQITADGIALTEYLIKRLAKQKVILFGTSWGSVPGIKMAAQRPDLFYAYVGHSQIVDPAENFIATYKKVCQMAEKANDKEAVDILAAIGAPPYASAKKCGKFMRVIKKYERQTATAAPDNWMVVATAYNNEKDALDRENGDDFSFVNFAGDEKLGVQPMVSSIRMSKDNLEFKIPIYLIQGAEDILTPREVTKRYFDAIVAPKKKYYLLPKTAHGFNLLVLEKQFEIFKGI